MQVSASGNRIGKQGSECARRELPALSVQYRMGYVNDDYIARDCPETRDAISSR